MLEALVGIQCMLFQPADAMIAVAPGTAALQVVDSFIHRPVRVNPDLLCGEDKFDGEELLMDEFLLQRLP